MLHHDGEIIIYRVKESSHSSFRGDLVLHWSSQVLILSFLYSLNNRLRTTTCVTAAVTMTTKLTNEKPVTRIRLLSAVYLCLASLTLNLFCSAIICLRLTLMPSVEF